MIKVNKFQLIRNISEASGKGIYYINDNIPDEFMRPMNKWIYDILSRDEIPYGRSTFISFNNFINKYMNGDSKGYNNFNFLQMTMIKQEKYYESDLNPIGYFSANDVIGLWGERIYSYNENKDICIHFLKIYINILNRCVNFDDFNDHIESYLQNLQTMNYIYAYQCDYNSNKIRVKIHPGLGLECLFNMKSCKEDKFQLNQLLYDFTYEIIPKCLNKLCMKLSENGIIL